MAKHMGRTERASKGKGDAVSDVERERMRIVNWLRGTVMPERVGPLPRATILEAAIGIERGYHLPDLPDTDVIPAAATIRTRDADGEPVG